MISHCASVVGFQLLEFPFIQIQQDDCSAAWPILCAAVLLHRPVAPNAENNHHTDFAGNPLHPTSTGKFQVCQPLPLHSVINSSCLALFCFATPLFPGDGSTRWCWSSSLFFYSLVWRVYMYTSLQSEYSVKAEECLVLRHPVSKVRKLLPVLFWGENRQNYLK